jgi:hypothetical protein
MSSASIQRVSPAVYMHNFRKWTQISKVDDDILIDRCNKGDYDGVDAWLKDNESKMRNCLFDPRRAIHAAARNGHARVLRMLYEFHLSLSRVGKNWLGSNLSTPYNFSVDVRLVLYCYDNVARVDLIITPALVWRAIHYIGVPRNTFIKASDRFKQYIEECETEVACAKKMLLEHTTLPLDLVNLIVGRM